MEDKKFNNGSSRRDGGRAHSEGNGRRFNNNDNSDRPRRSFNREDSDRPRRSFNREDNDRPRRSSFSEDGNRPRPTSSRDESGKRPRRTRVSVADSENGDRRPVSSSGSASRRPAGKPSSFKGKGGKPMPKKNFYKGKIAPEDPTLKDNTPKKPTYASKGLVRLNKYISNAGICSRRDADKLIEAGSVTVNGKVVTQMGYLVQEGDVVNYGGETLRSEAKRYFLLNKPKGYITTTDDPQERQTVMELIDGACKERIYPVGRLDRATTGLLLFTNDGEMAKRLTHPSSNVYKVYQVELDKPVTREDMRSMLEGIELEDGPIKVDDVQYAMTMDRPGIDKRIVGVQLHSGRNRIVRRIFESMGYTVHKLDRTVFAGLTKKDLPRGRYRELTEREVNFLKMI